MGGRGLLYYACLKRLVIVLGSLWRLLHGFAPDYDNEDTSPESSPADIFEIALSPHVLLYLSLVILCDVAVVDGLQEVVCVRKRQGKKTLSISPSTGDGKIVNVEGEQAYRFLASSVIIVIIFILIPVRRLLFIRE